MSNCSSTSCWPTMRLPISSMRRFSRPAKFLGALHVGVGVRVVIAGAGPGVGAALGVERLGSGVHSELTVRLSRRGAPHGPTCRGAWCTPRPRDSNAALAKNRDPVYFYKLLAGNSFASTTMGRMTKTLRDDWARR